MGVAVADELFTTLKVGGSSRYNAIGNLIYETKLDYSSSYVNETPTNAGYRPRELPLLQLIEHPPTITTSLKFTCPCWHWYFPSLCSRRIVEDDQDKFRI
jgi:hypothetical protein